jgi:hypothetical protein
MVNVGKNFPLGLDVELLFLFSDVFLLEHLHGVHLVTLDMAHEQHLCICSLPYDTQQ